MGREVVGLKIGATQLSAARVAANGRGQLLQVAATPLAPGIVSGGEVRDADALAGALKAFFGEHRLPRRAVRVGIANNRIGVRTVELAGIHDTKQLANAIRFRAQEVLPIPLEEAVLDYLVLGEGTDEEGTPTKRVLFVVAYRHLIDGYVQACKQGGLRLLGIDLEAFALLRAVMPLGESAQAESEERAAFVAVSIGSERSTLAVSDGVTCEFTRVIDWGGAALTQALAGEFGADTDEAERIKRSLSLDAGAAPEGLTGEQLSRARRVIAGGLQGFAREVVSSLQFYQGQPGSLGIREIVLAGGTARLPGLADALQRMIGVAVRVGDPLVNLTVTKRVKGGDADPSLAIAVGLGMGA